MSQPVPKLVDHLFRHASGRVVAGLTRQFGPRYLQLAEDALQEASLKALRLWPYRGVPDQPEAWLRTVARNQMIDALRREGRFSRPGELQDIAADAAADPDADLLAMLLMCCHPKVAPDAQVALMLKVVAGFDVREIARAFLAKEATVAQKLTRARRTIRDGCERLIAPDDTATAVRIDAVSAALYLMFNEGHAMSSGDAHISRDLCDEAIRLTRLVCERSGADRPDLDALLALMLFQASRLPARITRTGDILTLEEQDRALWDRDMIDAGVELLNRSARCWTLTAYHLQAGIASLHCLAPDYISTDWASILEHYDALVELSDSPLARLNRCVALAMVAGPCAGLRELNRILESTALERYALLHATAGELAWLNGDRPQAVASFDRARELVTTEPERRLIERKAARVTDVAR